MRVAFLILLIAITPVGGLATSSKRKAIVGTVVAYDYFNNLIQITFAPSRVSLIVQTRATRHEPSELIEVRYTYWSAEKSGALAFPDALVKRSGSWRFRLAPVSGCEPLKELVPYTDANTEKETGERLPIWKLLPGAENETLPFGKTLSCYSLEAHDYKPVEH